MEPSAPNVRTEGSGGRIELLTWRRLRQLV